MFAANIGHMTIKAEKPIGALAEVMSNIDGTKQFQRKLFSPLKR